MNNSGKKFMKFVWVIVVLVLVSFLFVGSPERENKNFTQLKMDSRIADGLKSSHSRTFDKELWKHTEYVCRAYNKMCKLMSRLGEGVAASDVYRYCDKLIDYVLSAYRVSFDMQTEDDRAYHETYMRLCENIIAAARMVKQYLETSNVAMEVELKEKMDRVTENLLNCKPKVPFAKRKSRI